MNILALETTGKYGSAAVMTDKGEIFSSSSSAEMNHLRDVIVISQEALDKAGIELRELTHVAASRGPGSFTGIRIGVTTARTLAQMLGIRCIGVSSLESMAVRAAAAARDCGADLVVSIINARRHQTYAGAWDVINGEECSPSVRNCIEERQYMIEDLLETLKRMQAESGRKILFTGDGIDAYGDIIAGTLGEGTFAFADEEIRYQHAAEAAVIASRLAAEGKTVSYEELLPEYMRLSEAEQRLKEGTLSDKIRKATGK